MTVRFPPPLALLGSPISLRSIPLSRLIVIFLLAILFLLLATRTAWSEESFNGADNVVITDTSFAQGAVGLMINRGMASRHADNFSATVQ